MQSDEQTTLATTDEIAAMLQVRPSTVREWQRRGTIPSIRLSDRIVRYDRAAVLAAVRARTSGQRA